MLTNDERQYLCVLTGEIASLTERKQTLITQVEKLFRDVICRSILASKWKILPNRTALECTDKRVEKQIKELFRSISGAWWHDNIYIKFPNLGINVSLNDNELEIDFHMDSDMDFHKTIVASGIEIDEQSLKEALAAVYLDNVTEARRKIIILEKTIATNEAAAAQILGT
jgi:hypothetical protein